MSKLDELITEFCPNGVEFIPLEKCCVILDSKRKPVTKSMREFGNYPYYGANGIQDYVSDYIFDGVFVLVGEDGSVLTPTGTPVVNWAEGKIWVNNHAHIIEEKEGVLLRYLFHFLQTVDVSCLIHGNIPKLTGRDFRAIGIPVPPLEVQREIVRILDNFTELTAELTARKQQYEYYRDMLLSFDVHEGGAFVDLFPVDGVEYKQLKELSSYCKDRMDATKINAKNYVGVENLLPNKQGKVGSSYVPIKGNLTHFHARDILIGNIRPYLKKIWFAEYEGGTNGDVLALHITDDAIESKFLYYCLSSDRFFYYDMQHSKGAKMPRGDKDAIMCFEIPVPPRLCQDYFANFPAISRIRYHALVDSLYDSSSS